MFTALAALTALALTPAALADEVAPPLAPTAETEVEPGTVTDARGGMKLRLTHGFRAGYTYVANHESSSRLNDPHLFVIGYEVAQKYGQEKKLQVLMIENLLFAGINQSLFIPSANWMLGFEIGGLVQVGTGVNLSLDENGDFVHMVAAIGFTPTIAGFNIPVHVSVIPDRNGMTRLSVTTGVNW